MIFVARINLPLDPTVLVHCCPAKEALSRIFLNRRGWGSRGGWKFPKNPIHGVGINGVNKEFPIAKDEFHKSFQLQGKRKHDFLTIPKNYRLKITNGGME